MMTRLLIIFLLPALYCTLIPSAHANSQSTLKESDVEPEAGQRSFSEYLTAGDWEGLRATLYPEASLLPAARGHFKDSRARYVTDYSDKGYVFVASNHYYGDGKLYLIKLTEAASGKNPPAREIPVKHSKDKPIVYDGRLVLRGGHSDTHVNFYSLKTGKLIKSITGIPNITGHTPDLYVKGNRLFIIRPDHTGKPALLTEINLDTMTLMGTNKGYSVGSIKLLTADSSKRVAARFAQDKSDSRLTPDQINWGKNLTLADLNLTSASCGFILEGNSKTHFKVPECEKDQGELKLLENNMVLLKAGANVLVLDPEALTQQEKIHQDNLERAQLLDKEISQFLTAINHEKYNSKQLIAFASAFPEYITEKEMKSRIAAYHNEYAKEQFGLSVITAVEETKKGSRYVPRVTNTYYSNEDQSYFLNGEYVYKTKPKQEVSSSGGYEVNITGHDLIFAIDNTKQQTYSVTLEATWTFTEYYYTQERYCIKGGLFGCSTYGNRSKRAEKTEPRKLVQHFLIGSEGRVKHSFYLGETKPDDLDIYISNIEKIDPNLFARYAAIMDADAESTPKETIAAIDELQKLPALKQFGATLDDRRADIRKVYQQQFSDEHLDNIEIEFEIDDRYDPDFKNDITATVTTSHPMEIELKVPSGKWTTQITNQTSGVEVMDYCLLCEYRSKPIPISIRGVPESELAKAIEILEIRPLD